MGCGHIARPESITPRHRYEKTNRLLRSSLQSESSNDKAEETGARGTQLDVGGSVGGLGDASVGAGAGDGAEGAGGVVVGGCRWN